METEIAILQNYPGLNMYEHEANTAPQNPMNTGLCSLKPACRTPCNERYPFGRRVDRRECLHLVEPPVESRPPLRLWQLIRKAGKAASATQERLKMEPKYLHAALKQGLSQLRG